MDTSDQEKRSQRGQMELANGTLVIKPLAPGQWQANAYQVECHDGRWTCTCPDAEVCRPKGLRCKHVEAVRFSQNGAGAAAQALPAPAALAPVIGQPSAHGSVKITLQAGGNYFSAELGVTVPVNERGEADPAVIATAVQSARQTALTAAGETEACVRSLIEAAENRRLIEQLFAQLRSLAVPANEARQAVDVLNLPWPESREQLQGTISRLKDLLNPANRPTGWKWSKPNKQQPTRTNGGAAAATAVENNQAPARAPQPNESLPF